MATYWNVLSSFRSPVENFVTKDVDDIDDSHHGTSIMVVGVTAMVVDGVVVVRVMVVVPSCAKKEHCDIRL